MRRVPQKAVLRTEYPFRTGNACFLHRMPLKMRRVPQEAFLSTARIFCTIEGPLRYRMPQSQNEKGLQRVLQIPERRRALPASSITKPKRRKALPATSITNTKKENALPASNATTARKEEASAKSAARLTGENKKRTTSKSFSFQFGVRCGARTHDTQNHNLVLYQLN